MTRLLLGILALTVALTALPRAGQAAEVRTWTSLQGATLEAEFVQFDGTTVFLKGTDGSTSWIALASLSEADREFVRARTAPATLPPTRARPTADANVLIEGTFEWNGKQGETHALEGTLKPTGPGEWTATWNFKWSGRAMTYVGTVSGDLQNGKISGTGVDTRARRTFTFEGTAKDGAWTFRHFETTRGRPQPTGPGTARVKS